METTASKTRKATNAPPTPNRRITRTMAADGPRQAVFNTAELLESIFLHLPNKTVFGVQRTCRQFRDIVATSSQLQKMLFLREPSTTPTETWALLSAAVTPTGRARIVRLLGPDSLPVPSLETAREDEGLTVYQVARSHNPLFQMIGVTITARSVTHGLLWRMRYGGEQFKLKAGTALLSDSSSWKHTYLSEPPCKKASISLEWKIAVKPLLCGIFDTTVSVSGILTVGGILDAAVRGANGSYSYFASWSWQKFDGRFIDLINRLECETGKEAIIVWCTLAMRDVLVSSEAERDTVKDYRPIE
ncbi:hypothetical protein LTR53_010904 [Teratosphaeriaceae sp. CCFEE 6253]|nr:hypothetical protein LTR53_010904 [Teratosphaeriaceae sp. CCFEE 6253]